MTVNIQKWGNSQGIRIPKYILNELAWSDDETGDISVEGGKIVIERIALSQKKNIKELFEGFEGKYEPSEFDWGETSGREVW